VSDVRVVIVGAGIAGVHCAVRLLQGGIRAQVYEASDRVGGRMYTGRGIYTDQVCELGGELIDSNHDTMWALCAELGLTLDDRTTQLGDGIWWLGGERVAEETLVEQLVALAPALARDVRRADTDDDAFDELDATTLRDWLDDNCAELPELSLAIEAAYVGEFGLEIDRQSALNLLYLIDGETTDAFHVIGDSDERWHVHEGNDAVVTGLAAMLEADQIATGHTLVALSGAGPYTLTLSTSDGDVVVEADHVVLALPFSTLRRVDTSLSAEKRAVVDALGYGTNAKVMGGFSSHAWLVHGCDGDIASDQWFQATWDSAIGQAGDGAILTNFLGGDAAGEAEAAGAEPWMDGVAGALDTLLPGVTAAYTGVVAGMFWASVPTALGSYACYLPGQWAIAEGLGVREGNIHFCGEHTSYEWQGWMEGAAQSGALVAAEVLEDAGLPLPGELLAVLGDALSLPQMTYRAWRWPWLSPPERRAVVRRLRLPAIAL
jgi:monoamine oxidase